MAPGHHRQLVLAFGQRDVKCPLPITSALQQKLQCEGCLAGSRAALIKIDAVRIQAAAKNVIQAFVAGRDTGQFAFTGAWQIVPGRHQSTLLLSKLYFYAQGSWGS